MRQLRQQHHMSQEQLAAVYPYHLQQHHHHQRAQFRGYVASPLAFPNNSVDNTNAVNNSATVSEKGNNAAIRGVHQYLSGAITHAPSQYQHHPALPSAPLRVNNAAVLNENKQLNPTPTLTPPDHPAPRALEASTTPSLDETLDLTRGLATSQAGYRMAAQHHHSQHQYNHKPRHPSLDPHSSRINHRAGVIVDRQNPQLEQQRQALVDPHHPHQRRRHSVIESHQSLALKHGEGRMEQPNRDHARATPRYTTNPAAGHASQPRGRGLHGIDNPIKHQSSVVEHPGQPLGLGHEFNATSKRRRQHHLQHQYQHQIASSPVSTHTRGFYHTSTSSSLFSADGSAQKGTNLGMGVGMMMGTPHLSTATSTAGSSTVSASADEHHPPQQRLQ